MHHPRVWERVFIIDYMIGEFKKKKNKLKLCLYEIFINDIPFNKKSNKEKEQWKN